MIDAYCALHEAGFAHSVETYQAGELVGGLYGISLGGMFLASRCLPKPTTPAKSRWFACPNNLWPGNFDLIDGQ